MAQTQARIGSAGCSKAGLFIARQRRKTFSALEQVVRCINLSVPCKHLER